MTYDITSQGPDFRPGGERMLRNMAFAHQAAVIQITRGMVREMRDDVIAAGLGQKLANAWRGEVYPERGASMEATGLVFVNAGKRRGPYRHMASAVRIIDLYATGKTITPLTGDALAVPTENVPFARGSRGSRRRMTPVEVEAFYNVELFVRRLRGGGVGLFATGVQGRNGRSFKPATKGRLAQGRKVETVLMFTLQRTIAGRQLLSPDRIFRQWIAQMPAAIDAHQRLGH